MSFSTADKLVIVLWLISLPLYKTGQCGCMRAATALNLLAVFISSENRHISTTLIVSHLNFCVNLQGLSIIHFLKRRKGDWKRWIRSKANGELKNNFVTVFQKRFAKKDGKACGKHKRFSVSTVQQHTHTDFCFFPFCYPSQSHFNVFSLFFRFYLFWN